MPNPGRLAGTAGRVLPPGAGPSLLVRPPTVTLPCNNMGAWYPNNYATSTLKPGQPTALAVDLFGGLMLGYRGRLPEQDRRRWLAAEL